MNIITRTGDNMEDNEIFVEVKMRIDESKYGQEPEILSIQAYHGDESDRKFGGSFSSSIERSLGGEIKLVTLPVKITKLKNKKYSNTRYYN
jgi:hypothetical protein